MQSSNNNAVFCAISVKTNRGKVVPAPKFIHVHNLLVSNNIIIMYTLIVAMSGFVMF